MTYINKNIFYYSAIFLIPIFLVIFTAEFTSSAEIEEDADMIMNYDYIITGEMNDYSETFIEVDGGRYSFCNKIIVYSPRNRRIPLKDLDAAKEVKLFQNKNCIRKIKVLRFAE